MIRRWRKQRNCFHHDYRNEVSWIRSALIDLGRRKWFMCAKCEKVWIV